MNYVTGAAFRRALEDRLRRHSIETGEPLFWLRQMVAFDRYLARLVATGTGDEWLLKGGMALQLRLGDRARTTKIMGNAVPPHGNGHRASAQIIGRCSGCSAKFHRSSASKSGKPMVECRDVVMAI